MASRSPLTNHNTTINEANLKYEPHYTKLPYTPPLRASERNMNSQYTYSIERLPSESSTDRNKCCCISNYRRQQFCLDLLYYPWYTLCYYVIILITIVALIYDLWDFKIENLLLSDEPTWYIALNMTCLALMVFDILIHVQAFQCMFFKSIINWLDFIFVMVCAAASPIYWFVIPSWVLLLLLFLRFTVRLLRRRTFRKQYVSARNIMVDFSAYESDKEQQQKYNNGSNP
eukprot:238205_1